MTDSREKSSEGVLGLRRIAAVSLGRDPGVAIRTVLFFVLFYLYLWLCLDLSLIYYSAGMITHFPVFFRGWAFFERFTSYPGGPGEYVAAFLAQFFYYSWAGALVVTLQALLIYICVGHYLTGLRAASLHWLRFAVPTLMLVLCSQYTYHFETTTTISLALLCQSLYLRMTRAAPAAAEGEHGIASKWPMAGALFVVFSVVVYYVAGAAYLLFAVLCAVRELRCKRFALAVVCLLCAVAVPYAEGVLFFGIGIKRAFTESLPSSWRLSFLKSYSGRVSPAYALFVIVSVVVFALGLWRFLGGVVLSAKEFAKGGTGKRGKSKGCSKPSSRRAGLSAQYARSGTFKWLVESLLVIAIVAAAAFFSRNGKLEKMLRIHYYTCKRMWPQVLETAGHKSTGYFSINAVNRALYHTGRLGSEMFMHPQHADALLLTGEDQVVLCWHKFDTQLDLGLLNMAQKNFVECMEIYGEHPLFLRRLALINMAKRNMNAARIYLTALTKTLFHAGWGREYLSELQADPELSSDERVQSLRSICMRKDYPTIFIAPELMYLTLLQENNKNRMAFEYVMASYMLSRQPGKLVQNLKWMNELGDMELPRHYQEAICIHAYGTNQPVFLHGRSLDPKIQGQTEQFNKVFDEYGRDKNAAIDALVQAHRGSYFFYHLYGFSGVKRK